MPMKNVNVRAWLGLVVVGAVMALLLFLPAGTARYWQAWAFLVVFIGASTAITLYLAKSDPALLRRRVTGGPPAEKQTSQKIIMSFTSIGFVALLVVPALDRRYGWSAMPIGFVILGDVMILAGYAIIFLVFKENSFASARIEVAADQRVISTGPYALVRHPMYAGALVYLLGVPLALGSWWGLIAFAALAPFLAWRLLDEERFLAKNLPGYADYCAKVRWRLVPGAF
jgi:protein-S-isoprenylcysteine O-methyltransferase Ste14